MRIKDMDFSRGEIVVRDGKGNKDRVTMLPEAAKESLNRSSFAQNAKLP
jgi:hypothetical protein